MTSPYNTQSPQDHLSSAWACIHDPPGYISPRDQDFDFSDSQTPDFDMTPNSDDTFPCQFPVKGRVTGSRHRLLVYLVCKPSDKRASDGLPRNILFEVNTGSPYTYLCASSMEALTGKATSSSGDIQLHSDNVVQCYLSPPDSKFAHVNVLGMDFLSRNKLSLSIDFNKCYFELQKSAR